VADQVEVSVTHQIKIGREDSWVKISIASGVQDNETLDTAIDRVDRVIQQKIFDVVNHTVEAVNKYEG
jgi:hypothetical protein